MNNFIKSKGWLESALIDLDVGIDLKNQRRLPSAVYHLQQSVEKGCKAIIAFFGIEVKYTHFPAEEIIRTGIIEDTDIVESLSLNEEHISLLRDIVSYAQPLEGERTKPRYGEELKDRIILPTEIYSQEKVNILFENGCNFWSTVLHFLGRFHIEEFKKVLEDVSAQIRKLRQD